MPASSHAAVIASIASRTSPRSANSPRRPNGTAPMPTIAAWFFMSNTVAPPRSTSGHAAVAVAPRARQLEVALAAGDHHLVGVVHVDVDDGGRLADAHDLPARGVLAT